MEYKLGLGIRAKSEEAKNDFNGAAYAIEWAHNVNVMCNINWEYIGMDRQDETIYISNGSDSENVIDDAECIEVMQSWLKHKMEEYGDVYYDNADEYSVDLAMKSKDGWSIIK